MYTNCLFSGCFCRLCILKNNALCFDIQCLTWWLVCLRIFVCAGFWLDYLAMRHISFWIKSEFLFIFWAFCYLAAWKPNYTTTNKQNSTPTVLWVWSRVSLLPYHIFITSTYHIFITRFFSQTYSCYGWDIGLMIVIEIFPTCLEDL